MDPRRRSLLLGAAAAALLPRKSSAMGKKAIPASGEQLPVIGLGTWQTFDVGNDGAARAPLREVLSLLNRNLIDSSPMYGSSESVAGDLLADLGIRKKLFVATKVYT